MFGKISSPHSGIRFFAEMLKVKSSTLRHHFNVETTKKATSMILLLAMVFSFATNFTKAQSSTLKQKRGNRLATPVLKVKSFDAAGSASGTVLKWATDTEVNHLGFNIYRDNDGKRVQLNQQLITNTTLSISLDAALPAGHSYEFIDNSVANDSAVYWLEALDIKGNASWIGPLTSQPGQVDFIQAETQNVRASVAQATSLSAPVESRAKLVKPSLLASKIQTTPPQTKALKLAVTHEGWYRVTQPDLIAAGLRATVDPRTLQLYNGGKAQQITVKGQEDGRFEPNDYIEFYGQGIDSTFSTANIYWLMEGSAAAPRIQTTPSRATPGQGQSFSYTIEKRDKTVYFSSLLNGDAENFFGAVIARQPLNQTLTVKHIDTTAEKDTTLRIALQGVNWYDHTLDIDVNGANLGRLNFFGQFPGEITFDVPHALWHEGDNLVTLTPLGGLTDITIVESIRLTYQHTYTADNDYLRLPAMSQEQITLWGFTNDSIAVFDVTNPQSVQKLNGHMLKREGIGGATEFGISVTAPGSGIRELLALTQNRVSQVAKLSVDSPSNWKTAAHGADFLIFTTKNFFSVAEELQALRKNGGLTTDIVDIEDVYDEFSFGQKTPFAIKDFLFFAKHNWSQPVRYILFLGDSSYDPKNYLNYGDSDIVPTKLADTIFLEAATDDWFADFDNDYISDIPVGRLPARNKVEAQTMVSKIIAYDKATPSNEVLLVADTNDVYDFESANTNLLPLLPVEADVTFVKRGQVGDSAARTQVLDSLNRGPKIVNYAGHGSIDLWRGNLLNNTDAMHLQNQQNLPLVVTMNCLNGYFQDPYLEGLSECLLKAPTGGAVAAWGSSSLTFAEEQVPANQELFRLLFAESSKGITIGEAAVRAKAMSYDADVRYSWILFGDPSMRLK
jgi:hypothetical protein